MGNSNVFFFVRVSVMSALRSRYIPYQNIVTTQISVHSEAAGVPPLQEPDDVWRLQTGLHAGCGTEHQYQHRQRQTDRETSVCHGHLQGW